MQRFKLKIELVSDWHVGSGWAAPGHLDSLVARDEAGLPFIPAKTIVGIWRDACELVARGLDNGSSGAWSNLVDLVFGSQPGALDQGPTEYHKDPTNKPIPAALELQPARLPQRLRELLSRDARLLAALTFTKPGVKIDPVTGQAEEDFLRFEEMCRGGISLSTDCVLDVPEEIQPFAEALLFAGAALAHRLGGKRRRGPGRCRFALCHADGRPITLNEIEDRLQTNPPTGAQRPASPANQGEPLPSSLSSDSWLCVDLRLVLQTPVLVPHRTVGNVVETLDFVPGYYLLPHVTRTLGALGVDPSNAIAAGDIRVLNGYVEINGQRGLPAPHAVHMVKDTKGYRSRELGASLRNRLHQSDGAAQLKPVRAGYVGWEGNAFLGYRRPSILVRTHSTIDDQAQRPTTEVGGVYSYEAISPTDDDGPVVLRSRLLIRRGIAEQLTKRDSQWWTRLNGPVRLGRSKKDDYGLAILTTAEPREPKASPPGTQQSTLYVWLVSDALLRSDDLRVRPDIELLQRELERLLGVTLAAQGVYAQQRRFESWNTRWGLPRPSLVTLAAGSCFAFTVSGNLAPNAIASAEIEGVGERKAEGFGEIRLNHPALTQPPSQWHVRRGPETAPRAEPELLTKEDEGYDYARLIEREAWKRIIARRALEQAAKKNKRQEDLGWTLNEGSKPPITQIMAFRQQVAQLRSKEDANVVLEWFARLEESRNRRPKWEETAALRRCKELLEKTDKVWASLGLDQPGELPRITEDAETLRDELWAYAVRCLVDAYARAHKRDAEQ